MNFVNLFIPMTIVALLLMWYRRRNTEVILVTSNVDGREYLVQNKQDKQQAADMLAQVRQRMIKLVEFLKQQYLSGAGGAGGETQTGGGRDDPDVRQFGSYVERTKRLVRRFNPDKISEGNEDVRYTTYTLNKGEKIVFCLRARGEGDHVHDLAMMTFVAIHEMGHVASITEHHTPEFNSNFKWLLDNAVKCGVYSYEDFRSRPRNYCGIAVTDSPLSA
jgi:hypothetical protein